MMTPSTMLPIKSGDRFIVDRILRSCWTPKAYMETWWGRWPGDVAVRTVTSRRRKRGLPRSAGGVSGGLKVVPNLLPRAGSSRSRPLVRGTGGREAERSNAGEVTWLGALVATKSNPAADCPEIQLGVKEIDAI